MPVMNESRRLLFVHWSDAKGCSPNWQFAEDLEHFPLERYEIDSVGFLLREDDESLHIAPHMHHKEGHYCGDMQIPKSAIIDIWEIEDGP